MADLPVKPSPLAPPANEAGTATDAGGTAAEARFWRGGAGAADTGTVPPEPGTTPAELEPVELEPAPEAEKQDPG
jgi:hypothetical protein